MNRPSDPAADGRAPRVSVVVPTYEHAEYVAAALESVFAQTYTDREVIVVDDGASGDTARVLAPLAGAGRVRWIRQPHQGTAAARNRGLAAARGELLALLDDDDLWPPDKLAWQVAALDADAAAGMVYGYCESFGDGGRFRYPSADTPSGSVRDAFLRRNRIISPGQTLLRTALVRELGGFDPSLWGTDDWDLYIRLAARARCLYVQRLALRYRRHADAASRDWLRLYRNARRVHRRHLGRVPLPGRFGVWWAGDLDLRQFYAGKLAEQADLLAAGGRFAEARGLWLRSLALHPGRLARRAGQKALLRAVGVLRPAVPAPAPEAPPSRCST